MPVKRDDAEAALAILNRLQTQSEKGKVSFRQNRLLITVCRLACSSRCQSRCQYFPIAALQRFARHSGLLRTSSQQQRNSTKSNFSTFFLFQQILGPGIRHV